MYTNTIKEKEIMHVKDSKEGLLEGWSEKREEENDIIIL